MTVLADHKTLAEELRRFVNDPEARTQHIAAAAVGAARVGRVDGGASERVIRAITRTVAQRSATGPALSLLAAERSPAL